MEKMEKMLRFSFFLPMLLNFPYKASSLSYFLPLFSCDSPNSEKGFCCASLLLVTALRNLPLLVFLPSLLFRVSLSFFLFHLTLSVVVSIVIIILMIRGECPLSVSVVFGSLSSTNDLLITREWADHRDRGRENIISSRHDLLDKNGRT